MSALDELAEDIKKKAKEHGKEVNDDEAGEAARNLTGFFELLLEISQKDAQKQKRLKKEPNGFPVDGNYSCLVCGISINEINGWYDWYGNTCLLCHKAVKDGIIPTFIFKHRDSYFPMWKLDYSFKIKHMTAKKYIRLGKLIPRIVLNENDTPYAYIFLKKENPDLIERYNPIRKSYDRNRAKVAEELSRKYKAEEREERRKYQEKIDKILKRN
jgi:hypothetical protein